MAACTSLNSQSVPDPFRRLFRAHVQAQHSRGVEVTAFVDASSRETAIRKIAQTIAALGRPLVFREHGPGA